MILAGVDLAWQSERNPSAIASGRLVDNTLTVTGIDAAVYGIDDVLDNLTAIKDLQGVAIDAPLIINNASGQRICETGIGKTYGSRHASCHTSNTKLYPDAKSVYLSQQLLDMGFEHLKGERWQIECYPHPAIIEMFGLAERLKYKKGRVQEKREGQKVLANFLLRLNESDELALNCQGEFMKILDASYIDSIGGQALKSNEDALDAVVCLYIAGLFSKNSNGEVFGDSDSGYIWIPQSNCL